MSFLAGLVVGGAGTLGAVAYSAKLQLGSAYLLAGTGAPTGDPGVHPVVYIRQDPASAATVLYVCHTGSTWTAITP